MRKLRTTLLAIGVATILTGCGMAETPSSPTTEETTTVEKQTEVTTTSPEEETTTTKPQEEINYDKERIKVTKWDMNSYGCRIPLKVIVDGVTYEYIYDETLRLRAIKGSDGTSIELRVCDEGYKEDRNGITVIYFHAQEPREGDRYIGFEYQGKKYTYEFTWQEEGCLNRFITGILDEDNKLVAEYKYIYEPNRTIIEVINHTEDNIGDINSMRYGGNYYDRATGFVRIGSFVYTVVNANYEWLKG